MKPILEYIKKTKTTDYDSNVISYNMNMEQLLKQLDTAGYVSFTLKQIFDMDNINKSAKGMRYYYRGVSYVTIFTPCGRKYCITFGIGNSDISFLSVANSSNSSSFKNLELTQKNLIQMNKDIFA